MSIHVFHFFTNKYLTHTSGARVVSVLGLYDSHRDKDFNTATKCWSTFYSVTFTERTVWRNLMCREKISWTQPLLQSLWTWATGDLMVLLYFFTIRVNSREIWLCFSTTRIKSISKMLLMHFKCRLSRESLLLCCVVWDSTKALRTLLLVFREFRQLWPFNLTSLGLKHL